MIKITAEKARKITEESSQIFKRELIDKIESDIIRRASKGYNEVVTSKFMPTKSSSLLGEKYLEDVQSIKNQLEEVGYTVDVKETAVSKFVDPEVKIEIKVSW